MEVWVHLFFVYAADLQSKSFYVSQWAEKQIIIKPDILP